MNLRHLSDDQLISKTRLLVKQERELLTEVLHHLSEVGRRRLFSSLKFKSLFEYAVKELGYSDDQAYRRVKAAELLQQIPEIEAKIESGNLNLANLSVAASAIYKTTILKSSRPTKTQVRKIVELVEGKSKREAEATLVKEEIIDAQELRPEKVRQVGDSVEIRMTLSKEMVETILQLKSLMAHSHPNMTTAELFEKLCVEKLNSLVAKRRGVKVAMTTKTEDVQKLNGQQALTTGQKVEIDRKLNRSATRRAVWIRAKHRCENCKSQHSLEVDHVFPKAKGGGDDLENLRILCRNCNQRSAINHFGLEKMERYLTTKPL